MNYFKHLSLLCFMLLALLFSCKENIDTSNRYVFRERTIASYLTSHEQFSDYVKLLKAQKISDLSETSVYQLKLQRIPRNLRSVRRAAENHTDPICSGV